MIFDIALGIIGARLLIHVFKDLGRILTMVLERVVPRNAIVRPSEPELRKATEQDWAELWAAIPQEVKEHVHALVEDRRLRCRAQELDLWSVLWESTSEDVKARMRTRWQNAKV